MKLIITLVLLALAYETVRMVHLGLIAVKFGKSTVPFTQRPTHPSRHILIVGDSIGVGVGASSPSLSLAGRIGQLFHQAQVSNLSLSGATAEMAFKYLSAQNLDHYDLIILSMGGMDTVSFTKFSKFEKNFRYLLDLLNSHSKAVALLLPYKTPKLPMYRFPSSPVLAWRVKRVRKISKKVADEKKVIILPDTFDRVLNDKEHNFFLDKSHPNDQGYKLWFEDLESSLKQLIS